MEVGMSIIESIYPLITNFQGCFKQFWIKFYIISYLKKNESNAPFGLPALLGNYDRPTNERTSAERTKPIDQQTDRRRHNIGKLHYSNCVEICVYKERLRVVLQRPLYPNRARITKTLTYYSADVTGGHVLGRAVIYQLQGCF